MVRLDGGVLRYLNSDEFRVLTAIEMGMKNHEIVPNSLIARIANMKGGLALKCIKSLHRNKLIRHSNEAYDGYKLTFLGYDYLSLKALVQRGKIKGLGRKIGVGKESDVYEVSDEHGKSKILKIHRLGRTCFRQIKNKRDYLLHRKSASWLYLSRLSALREYAYMKCLYDHGFVVPIAFDQNRHCVLMEYIENALPLGSVNDLPSLSHTTQLFSSLMNMLVRLAEHGLIHGDFNEFNLLYHPSTNLCTMIDFPQMVSTSHANAAELFARDVDCIRKFFLKKFAFEAEEWPKLEGENAVVKKVQLDVVLQASGSSTGPAEKAAAKAFREEDRKMFEEFLVNSRANADEKEDGIVDEDDEDDDEMEEALEDEWRKAKKGREEPTDSAVSRNDEKNEFALEDDEDDTKVLEDATKKKKTETVDEDDNEAESDEDVHASTVTNDGSNNKKSITKRNNTSINSKRKGIKKNVSSSSESDSEDTSSGSDSDSDSDSDEESGIVAQEKHKRKRRDRRDEVKEARRKKEEARIRKKHEKALEKVKEKQREKESGANTSVVQLSQHADVDKMKAEMAKLSLMSSDQQHNADGKLVTEQSAQQKEEHKRQNGVNDGDDENEAEEEEDSDESSVVSALPSRVSVRRKLKEKITREAKRTADRAAIKGSRNQNKNRKKKEAKAAMNEVI